MSILLFALCLQLAGTDSPKLSSTTRDPDAIEKLVRISRQKFPMADQLPGVVQIVRENRDDSIRVLALQALAAFRTRARSEMPMLQELSGPGHPIEIRQSSLSTMVAIGGNSQDILQRLYAVIDHEQEPGLRQVAIGLIGKLRANDERAERACLKCLEDADPNVCSAAIAAVGSSEIVSDPVVARLRSLVYDERTRVRFYSPHVIGSSPLAVDAVECLEKLAIDDPATLKALQEGLKKGEGRVQLACAISLQPLATAGDEELLATCRAISASDDIDSQLYLCLRIAEMRSQWAQAPRVLAWLAVAEDVHVRKSVEVTMREISGENQSFIWV